MSFAQTMNSIVIFLSPVLAEIWSFVSSALKAFYPAMVTLGAVLGVFLSLRVLQFLRGG